MKRQLWLKSILASALFLPLALACNAASTSASADPASASTAPAGAAAAVAPAKVKAKAVKTVKVKTLKSATKATAAVVPVQAAEGAALVLKGDSTLHKWTANASQLSIVGEVAAEGSLLDAVKVQGLKSLKVTVVVDGLKSTEGKSMDKNMYKALESSQFSEVTFTLVSYSLTGSDVLAKGSLNIHGVAKDVELKGVLSEKDGAVSIKGSYPLKMSEYGIKPPVMMLGTIKVRDDVTVDYDFALKR